jgi:UDP-glucose:(heptosyl)LPS alpha-1,3-glucosyltransferase
MLRGAKQASLWWAAKRAIQGESWDAVLALGRTTGHTVYRAGGGSHLEFLRRCQPWKRWLDPAQWLHVAMDRHAVESARVVIANSQQAASALRRDYRPRRVEVVYNGVDPARFRPDAQVRAQVRAELGAREGPVALFLGTGFHRKGLDRAIAALPPGWTLWVAGAGRPWVAPDHVRFLGAVREPERLLQSADVMLLPTRYDPFANATLEALASGIPAVTTSANGASEVLPEASWICDDVDSARRTLLELAERRHDPALAEKCLEVARGHEPRFGYARALEILVEASR